MQTGKALVGFYSPSSGKLRLEVLKMVIFIAIPDEVVNQE